MTFLIFSSLFLYAAGFISIVFYHISKKRPLPALSAAFIISGLASHSAAIFLRTFVSGHLPVANVGETLLFYSWATVLISVIVILRYGERSTEIITIPLAILGLINSFFTMTSPRPLPLILRTYWFEIHVITSFAAYALFTLAFSGSLLYLLGNMKKSEEPERLRDFQDISVRGVLWGFFFFSVSMFAGAIWAYLAWGAYWMWEPKILWSFIVWFWYAGAMHAFYVKRWQIKGLAVLSVIGFFIVLFTYLGVGLLMKSSHSF